MADPKSCRERAIRCAELANTVGDDRLQTALFDMAANWLKVAMELERLHALLDDEALGLRPGS